MAKTYYISDSTSDLSGDGDFNRVVSTATAGSATLLISIASSATERSYGFTAAGEPGTNGDTGDYTIEIRVTGTNTAINMSVQVHRINSSGTVQNSSSTTATQTAGASRTFSLTGVNLGTWTSGDRLRVDYIFQNTNAHSAQSFTMGFNTTDDEVITPFVGVTARRRIILIT